MEAFFLVQARFSLCHGRALQQLAWVLRLDLLNGGACKERRRDKTEATVQERKSNFLEKEAAEKKQVG